jgi:hypothetical protein
MIDQRWASHHYKMNSLGMWRQRILLRNLSSTVVQTAQERCLHDQTNPDELLTSFCASLTFAMLGSHFLYAAWDSVGRGDRGLFRRVGMCFQRLVNFGLGLGVRRFSTPLPKAEKKLFLFFFLAILASEVCLPSW